MSKNWYGITLYFISVIIAMCLKVMPLRTALQAYSPDWVLLVLIYWLLASPYQWGVFSAWSVGLFMDVLTGYPLGHYALIYAVISYICLKFYKRVRNFPVIQQGVFIFCCLLSAQLLALGIESFHRPVHFQWVFLLPAMSGTLVWPIAGRILRGIHDIGHVR